MNLFTSAQQLAPKHFDAMMSDLEYALKCVESQTVAVRIAAIQVCLRHWGHSLPEACFFAAENAQTEREKSVAFGVLGTTFEGTGNVEVSRFLANQASLKVNPEYIKLLAFWTLKEVQGELRPGKDDYWRHLMWLARMGIEEAGLNETLARKRLVSSEKKAEDWQLSSVIDEEYVRSFLR